VTIPIPLDARLPVASYQTVVGSVAAMLNEVDGRALGADRTLMLPSLSLSVAEMHAAAQSFAARHGLPIGTVTSREQEVATRIVRGMGSRADGARAVSAGLPRDESADSIVAVRSRLCAAEAPNEQHQLTRAAGGAVWSG